MALKETFFIASLPRARTAWLANWLTTGEVTCHHEALRYCDAATAGSLRKYFEATGTPYVGDSDCGLPFIMDDVMTEFPGAKLVVIERGIEPVIQSLHKTFPRIKTDFREIVLKAHLALERTKQKYHPLVIGFEELNDMKVCQKLWEHCLPKLKFCESRWKMLEQLTVEIHPQKYLASFPAAAVSFLAAIMQNYK